MRARLRSCFSSREQKSPKYPLKDVRSNPAFSSDSSTEDWKSVDETPPSPALSTECSTDQESTDESPPETSYHHSAAKKLWYKVKKQYALVEFHALPEYLRGNEFILRHYRADWPLYETLLSIFRLHNETLNIWTHLIGFLLFLGLTIYTVLQMPTPTGDYPSLSKLTTLPTFSNLNKLNAEIMACFLPLPPFIPPLFGKKPYSAMQQQHIATSNPKCIMLSIKDDLGKIMAPFMRKPTTRWPFFIFLGGAMFCLLTSSTCHLLCCHSSRLSDFLWRFDYAGITAMIATSFFPPVYYTFLCHPKWRDFYLTSISIIGIMTVLVTLTPSLQRSQYRTFRTLLFCGMGVFGVIPGVHKLISHNHEPVTFTTFTYEALMGFFYGVGAIFYTTRIPERWRPGSFDIAGHSHQIFHVLVVCGAYTHYKAALLYIEWRDVHGCD